MAAKALPSQEVLRQLLRYEPETGKLFWRERPTELFESPRIAKRWNSIYAGTEAFTTLHATGYVEGRIFGLRYKAHRVIWKLVYGTDPYEIDHINGQRAFNALANLREVNRQENSRNRALCSTNTSGVTGVFFHTAASKWVAKIGVGFDHVHLGTFDKFDDAVAARRTAEIEHGFHQNHGRST